MFKAIKYIIPLIISLIANGQISNTQYAEASIKVDSIYLDEDGQHISKDIFNRKLNSNFYYGNVYEADNLVIGKLQWSHYFGTLSEELRHQFFKFLTDKYSIDTTKVMAIHYLDTLQPASSYPSKDQIITLENGKHIHKISFKTYKKSYKECEKRFKKNKHANVYHFYSINNGHPDVIDKTTFLQDFQHKIKLLFNKNDKQATVILLHPNGHYLIHYRTDGIYSSNVLTQLEKNERWQSYLTDFQNKTSVLNSYKKPLVTADN